VGVWLVPDGRPAARGALETRPASDTIGRREGTERAEPGAALSEAPRCGARPLMGHTDTSTPTFFFVSTREKFPVEKNELCAVHQTVCPYVLRSGISSHLGRLHFSRCSRARRKSDEKTSQRRVVLGRAPRASRAPQTRAVRRRVVEPGCLRDRARARTARCSSRACKAASCATPATCAGTCPFSACDGRATCATTSVRVERRRSVSERARVDRGDVSLAPDELRIAAVRRLGRARREDVANARTPRVFRLESFVSVPKTRFPISNTD